VVSAVEQVASAAAAATTRDAAVELVWRDLPVAHPLTSTPEAPVATLPAPP
jgi:hypothetical protein